MRSDSVKKHLFHTRRSKTSRERRRGGDRGRQREVRTKRGERGECLRWMWGQRVRATRVSPVMCRWLSLSHQACNASLKHYSYAIMDHHPLQLFLPVCHWVCACVCRADWFPNYLFTYASVKLKVTVYMLYNVIICLNGEHSLDKELHN